MCCSLLRSAHAVHIRDTINLLSVPANAMNEDQVEWRFQSI